MTFGKAMKEVSAEIIYTFNDKSTFVLPIAEKGRSAYEYVLLGALHGNNMLRADIGQVIGGWKLMEAIKKYQESKNSKLIPYDKHGNFFDKLKNTV
jgi:glucose-6-phosphate 1-dehydrogenase